MDLTLDRQRAEARELKAKFKLADRKGELREGKNRSITEALRAGQGKAKTNE